MKREGDRELYLNVLNNIGSLIHGKIAVDAEIVGLLAHEDMDSVEFRNRVRAIPRGGSHRCRPRRSAKRGRCRSVSNSCLFRLIARRVRSRSTSILWSQAASLPSLISHVKKTQIRRTLQRYACNNDLISCPNGPVHVQK